MIFEDYDDSVPPPESRFVVPESCMKTTLLKSPLPISSSFDPSETFKMLGKIQANKE